MGISQSKTSPQVRSQSRSGWFWMPLLAMLLDISAIFLAAVITFAVRYSEPFVSVRTPQAFPELGEYMLFGFVLGLVYVLIARSYRYDLCRARVPLEREVGRILTGAVLSMGLVLAAIFFYREFMYSRAIFLGTLILMILLLVLVRAVFFRIQKALFRRGFGLQRVALWGWGTAAQALYEEFTRARSQGFDLIGVVGQSLNPNQQSLGSLEELSEIAAKHKIDFLVISLPPGEEERMAEGMKAVEGTPVELLYAPGMFEMMPSRMQFGDVGGKPLLRLKGVPHGN